MIIGVPKEIKADEYRVSLLPVGAQLLVQDGHEVLIEKNAGLASGYHDKVGGCRLKRRRWRPCQGSAWTC